MDVLSLMKANTTFFSCVLLKFILVVTNRTDQENWRDISPIKDNMISTKEEGVESQNLYMQFMF